MPLKRKILLSFFAGAAMIALLSAFLFVNFAEIRRETLFLEASDSIRSKSLQLRRHEKNFFLYAPATAGEESRAMRDYLGQLDELLEGLAADHPGRLTSLKPLLRDYRVRFARIETLVDTLAAESARLRAASPAYARVGRLVEANFLDKPLEDVAFLEAERSLGADERLVSWLRELDGEINGLRRTGESILSASKEVDQEARGKVDAAIRRSRTAIFAVYPLFLLVGFGTTLAIAGGVVRRLRTLAALVEETGRGHFAVPGSAPRPAGAGDEVDALIRTFYAMEEQLQRHEEELLQAKKLAAIGTFAAGVAHELNNPLNNIYTTAQRLLKRAAEAPEPVRKGLDDIHGQTLRVKGIVGDLLEFARGRPPHLATVELGALVQAAWRNLAATRDVAAVSFEVALTPREIVLEADREQLERVFINLFSNALDAMPEGGRLEVSAVEGDGVTVRVADRGQGMPPEVLEKIFEPFYTSKDRGTGLGLAIVFAIVRKHGGTIRAESAPGAGTAFTIELPRRAAVQAAGGAAAPAEGARA